jgi:hypothetical protein
MSENTLYIESNAQYRSLFIQWCFHTQVHPKEKKSPGKKSRQSEHREMKEKS